MRILNYFREKNQVIGELERVKKGKHQVEEKFDEMMIETDKTNKKYTLQLEKNNALYEEKAELFYKVKELKKELAEAKELIKVLDEGNKIRDKRIKRLSKENEKLLAQQLGE